MTDIRGLWWGSLKPSTMFLQRHNVQVWWQQTSGDCHSTTQHCHLTMSQCAGLITTDIRWLSLYNPTLSSYNVTTCRYDDNRHQVPVATVTPTMWSHNVQVWWQQTWCDFHSKTQHHLTVPQSPGTTSPQVSVMTVTINPSKLFSLYHRFQYNDNRPLMTVTPHPALCPCTMTRGSERLW